MSLFQQNEYFYRVKYSLIELIFLKGDTNICFEYIALFEKKKNFTKKNKIFVKIIHIFKFFFLNSFATFELPYPDVLVKKVFLKILQNSLENACARASFLIKL